MGKHKLYAAAISILLLLLTSCGGGGSEQFTPAPPPPPSFSISLSPSTSQTGPATVKIGTDGASITVTVVGQNNFAGTVNFSTSGLPVGVSVNPATWSLTAGTSQDVIFTATSNASTGASQITISGTSGSLSDSVNVFLEIEAFLSGTIGPTGGTIAVTDPSDPLFGLKLNIPPGALSQSTDIEVNPAATPAAPIPNALFVGQAIDLRPSGLTFASPVMLTMPYPDRNGDGLVDDSNNNGLEAEYLQMFWFDKQTVGWVHEPHTRIDLRTRTISAEIEHFSSFSFFLMRFASNDTVTYAVGALPTNRQSGLTDDAVKAAVRAAIRGWQDELARSGISTVEQNSPTGADIIFRWGDDRDAFKRTSKLICCTFAERWYPQDADGKITHAEIVFNDSLRFIFAQTLSCQLTGYVWTADPRSIGNDDCTVNIQAVALHEIGHALGLNHTCSNCNQLVPPAAIMNAGLELDRLPQVALFSRDLWWFRKGYGLIHAESSPPSSLFTIDPVSPGTDRIVGPIRTTDGSQPAITDIALSPRLAGDERSGGQLFGISGDKLYKIDISNGMAEEVAPLTPLTIGLNALTFDRNGTLYGAGGNTLVRVNPANGAIEVVGFYGSGFSSSGDLQFWDFLDLAPLYATVRLPGSPNDFLITVDPLTGTAVPVNASADLGFAFVFGLGFSSPYTGPGSPVLRKMFGLTANNELIEVFPNLGTARIVRSLQFSAWGASAIRTN